MGIRDRDGAVQGVHDATDYRESQACAFLACFASPKSLENLLTKLGRYARTRIANLDRWSGRHANPNGLPGRTVVERILNQIADGNIHDKPIAANEYGRRRFL